MWVLILYYFFNTYIHIYLYRFHIILSLFHLLSFTSLTARHVLQSKMFDRFNYNLPSIIITIFQTESFHFLNWKVSQLKYISLIKLISTRGVTFHSLLVTRFKFTRYSLPVVKSLVTREIRSLLVANSLVVRYSLQNHSLLVAKLALYSLQKLLIVKNQSLLVANSPVARYSL